MIRVDWLALLVASLFGLLLVTLVARLITWRLSRVPISLLNNSRPARYMLLGRSARTMSNLESDAWRNQKTGFSLQESTLISKLSSAGSIKLPLLCAGTPDKGAFEKIRPGVGLSRHRVYTWQEPLECSSEGKQEQSSLAVIMNLEVVRIDEPTAALDSVNKSRIIALLFGLKHDS